MKWFKHQTSMRHDPRIKRVIRKYGADGYALYNYILESIAGKLNPRDPIPNLEETSEDIAFDLKLDTLRVQEIVAYCLEQGLFSQDEVTGHILCLKMYKFLDDATRKSASVVDMLNSFAKLSCNEVLGKIPSDTEQVRQIPSNSGKVRPDKELDKELKPDKDSIKTFSPELCKFTEDFVKFVSEKRSNKAPKNTKALINNSLDTLDKLIRIDGFSLDYIKDVSRWAIDDEFFSTNFFSLAPLRSKSKNGATKFANMASKYDASKKTGNQNQLQSTEWRDQWTNK